MSWDQKKGLSLSPIGHHGPSCGEQSRPCLQGGGSFVTPQAPAGPALWAVVQGSVHLHLCGGGHTTAPKKMAMSAVPVG